MGIQTPFVLSSLPAYFSLEPQTMLVFLGPYSSSSTHGLSHTLPAFPSSGSNLVDHGPDSSVICLSGISIKVPSILNRIV